MKDRSGIGGISSTSDFGTPPKKRNAAFVPVTKRLGGLLRIGLHEAGVAVRQVDRKEVDLALDPGC
jgi:hypothetical protein